MAIRHWILSLPIVSPSRNQTWTNIPPSSSFPAHMIHGNDGKVFSSYFEDRSLNICRTDSREIFLKRGNLDYLLSMPPLTLMNILKLAYSHHSVRPYEVNNKQYNYSKERSTSLSPLFNYLTNFIGAKIVNRIICRIHFFTPFSSNNPIQLRDRVIDKMLTQLFFIVFPGHLNIYGQLNLRSQQLGDRPVEELEKLLKARNIIILESSIAFEFPNNERPPLIDWQVASVNDILEKAAELETYYKKNEKKSEPNSINIVGPLFGPLPFSCFKKMNPSSISLEGYEGRNSFISIPDSFEELPDLTTITIQDYRLGTIPVGILNSRQITTLSLQSCNLTSIPDSIRQLSSLQKLVLPNNQISSFPPPDVTLPNLKELDLSGNGFQTIPSFILTQTTLKTLLLSNNKISTLPSSFTSLSKLEELWLNENNFLSFPDEIENLGNLENLNLSQNPFDYISKSAELPALKRLMLSKCNLREIPGFISNSTNLEAIDLSGNFICYIPYFLSDLNKSLRLYMFDNPISNIPASLKNRIVPSDFSITEAD